MATLTFKRTTDSNVIATSIKASSQSRAKTGQINRAPLLAIYVALKIIFILRALRIRYIDRGIFMLQSLKTRELFSFKPKSHKKLYKTYDFVKRLNTDLAVFIL